jgi:hypothetical protein
LTVEHHLIAETRTPRSRRIEYGLQGFILTPSVRITLPAQRMAM